MSSRQPYDRTRSLYLPSDSALSLWRAALARAGDNVSPARWHSIGDSNTLGFNFTPQTALEKTYTAKLRAITSARCAQTATAMHGPININAVGTYYTSAFPASSPANWYGTNVSNVVAGLNATSATADYTVGPFTCDSITLYVQYNGLTPITYAWNGGSTSTIAVPNVAGIQKLTINAPSRASNTLTFRTPASGGGTMYFYYAEPNDSTIQNVIKFGAVGATGSTAGAGSSAVWSGTSAMDAGISAVTPDLVSIWLGINDIDQNLGASAYQTGLTSLVQRARAVNADPIIITPWPGTPNNVATMRSYVNAAYAVAEANNCALFDLTRRWPISGTAASAPYSYGADSLHISSRGHQDIASMLYNSLIAT